MPGQKTNRTPSRPKKSSQDVFYGNIQDFIESQSNDDGDIVAYSQVVYLNSADDEVPSQGSSHGKAHHGDAAHPENEIGEETGFSHGDGGATPSTFDQPIAGFVRTTRNKGRVIPTSKAVYIVDDGGQLRQVLREESGTLECEGVVQGLLGRGRSTEPVKSEEKRATKAGKSREHSQINASQPKN